MIVFFENLTYLLDILRYLIFESQLPFISHCDKLHIFT